MSNETRRCDWCRSIAGGKCGCPAEVEIERLRAALADAIECVESWSAYAAPYFAKKHNLAFELARLRAYLEDEK